MISERDWGVGQDLDHEHFPLDAPRRVKVRDLDDVY